MEVWEAVLKRRSIRRFADKPVSMESLRRIAEAARLSPTGSNRQPLAFALTADSALCGQIFPHTRWAGRIPGGEAGPDAKTQPRAYVAILIDRRLAKSSDTDAGAAAMSIILTAEGEGLASCWVASVGRTEVLALLGLDGERYALHSVVALGYPAMRSRAVPMRDGDEAYYLEDKDSLCVPKRAAEDVVLWR